jgi:hypothetical protein
MGFEMRLRWILIGCFFAMSCGQHRPGVFEDRDLNIEWPDSQNSILRLVNSEFPSEFAMGSLLVWNPSISPSDVKSVIESNRERRDLQRQVLEERTKNIISDGGSELVRLRHQAREIEIQLSRNNALSRQHFAESWFDQEIALLNSNQSSERSKQVFSVYCQAKLWERAMEATLIHLLHHRRPSPLVMCEKVYRQLGLFEYGGSADCADSVEAKSYFGCLWSEGVLKTELFRLHRWGSDPVAREEILKVDPELVKQNIIWDQTLRTKFLQQKKFKIVPTQNNETSLLELGPVEKPAMPEFADDSVFSIIFNIENRKKRFFAVDANGLELSQEMTANLAMIARPTTAISIHEYWFNLPQTSGETSNLVMPAPSDIHQAERKFQELMRSSDPETEAQLNEIKTAISRKLTVLRPRLEKLISGDCREQAMRLMCQEQIVQSRAVASSRKPDIGQALFANMSIRFVRFQDGNQCADLKFDARRSQSIMLCSAAQSQQLRGLELDSDADVLRLNFRLNADGADLVGLGQTRENQQGQTAVDYNDMNASDWLGPIIRMELVLGSWRDEADQIELSNYLTGKVWAETKDSERIWLGSVFLREANPASQAGWDSIVESISMAEK